MRCGKARLDPLSPDQLVGCPSQDGARVAIDQRNATVQVDSEQDDFRRVQVSLCTVALLTQSFLRLWRAAPACGSWDRRPHRSDRTAVPRSWLQPRRAAASGPATRCSSVVGFMHSASARRTWLVSLRLPMTRCTGNGSSLMRVGVTMMPSASARSGCASRSMISRSYRDSK